MPTTPVTRYQQRKFREFVKSLSDSALTRLVANEKLDNDALKRLIAQPDDFHSRMYYMMLDLSRPVAKSRYLTRTYPPAHRRVKSLKTQVNTIRRFFPDIGFADMKLAERPLPPYAEGRFAIPKWETIAPTCAEAVQKVFSLLAMKRSFQSYCVLGDGEERLVPESRTVAMFQKLADEQTGFDILVVPAQFGLKYAGLSVSAARSAFAENECGLGLFAVGIMLLTHPEREVRESHLHVDCAGDNYFRHRGDFWAVPFFSSCEYGGGKKTLVVDSDGESNNCQNAGSASAFLW